MTCTCPFENRSHKEYSVESLQSQTKPWRESILRHCMALTYHQATILDWSKLKKIADDIVNWV